MINLNHMNEPLSEQNAVLSYGCSVQALKNMKKTCEGSWWTVALLKMSNFITVFDH